MKTVYIQIKKKCFVYCPLYTYLKWFLKSITYLIHFYNSDSHETIIWIRVAIDISKSEKKHKIEIHFTRELVRKMNVLLFLIEPNGDKRSSKRKKYNFKKIQYMFYANFNMILYDNFEWILFLKCTGFLFTVTYAKNAVCLHSCFNFLRWK